MDSNDVSWLVDGIPATEAEVVQIERWQAGVYGPVPAHYPSASIEAMIAFDKPIWYPAMCKQLIAKYPDEKELWRRAIEHLAKEESQGASPGWVAACFDALEKEWNKCQ